MLRRRDVLLGLLATPAISRMSLAQEITQITIVNQYGLPYLPVMVMNTLKLVETAAQKAGLPNLKVDYRTLGGTSSLVDALISGQMHFGVAGAPSLATLWDKTVGTANEVRGLCAAQSMPFMLVTSNPKVKTIRDFSAEDKIAVPSIKVSAQAVCLQMAAAKEWGQDQYARLDPFTITLPHPDAAINILAKARQVTSHYSVMPFYVNELATAGVTKVLSSYDTLGGATTNGVVLMSRKFGDANPNITAAVYAAFGQAAEFINRNPADAADIYIKATSEKHFTREELAAMIVDPDNVWTTTPQNCMRYFEFMSKVGSVKHPAENWKNLFMPICHELPGS